MARKKEGRVVPKRANVKGKTSYSREKMNEIAKRRFSTTYEKNGETRSRKRNLFLGESNFPYIGDGNMMVYTVPTTLAYRYSQMASEIDAIVQSVHDKVDTFNEQTVARLNMVYKLCHEQENKIKQAIGDLDLKKYLETEVENAKKEIQEIGEVFSMVKTVKKNTDVSKEINNYFKNFKKFHKKTFTKKTNTYVTNISKKVIGADKKVLKELIQSEINKMLKNLSKDITSEAGNFLNSMFTHHLTSLSDRLTTYIVNKILKHKKETEINLDSVIREALSPKNLKLIFKKEIESFMGDYRTILEFYNQIALNCFDKNESGRVLGLIQEIDKRKNTMAEKLGFLEEILIQAALLSQNSKPNSIIEGVTLIPQEDQDLVTSDISILLKNNETFGVSIKSNIDEQFNKRQVNVSGKFSLFDKEVEAFSPEGQEQNFLRFVTMSAASMNSLGITVPDEIADITQKLRLAYMRLGVIKAVLGQLLLDIGNLEENQIETKDFETMLRESTRGFPLLVQIHDRIEWSSDVVRLAIKYTVDEAFQDSTNVLSMNKLFNIKNLVNWASNLHQYNFRYVYISDRNYSNKQTTNMLNFHRKQDSMLGFSDFIELFNGSMAARPIMEAINELFDKNLATIYSSNITIFADFNKGIKTKKGGR